MYDAVESPYLVPFDGSFNYLQFPTCPDDESDSKNKNKKKLAKRIAKIADLQRVMYAHDHHSVLMIFQAMDAAGKDSTIRAVLTGVNPAGCQVFCFKKPSDEELDHDFLWRCAKRLPQRGRIGVFNRSYYEEVLVVRVHPELLEYQRIPKDCRNENIWDERYESIRNFEQHLARNGTVVIKFWLNVSKDEQRARFLSRIEEQEKNWKFNAHDIEERKYWNKYMDSYNAALNATSRSWAPWYAIPADDKPFMRYCVSDIIVRSLEQLSMHYPVVDEATRAAHQHMYDLLKDAE